MDEIWTGAPRRAKPKRPGILDKVVPIYDPERNSKYPDSIRVSFGDGSTMVYDIHVELPHPKCMESIEIIRKWNTGYNNQPMRRRKKP